MKQFLRFAFLFFTCLSFTQELTMQNGSWTECNFLLTDSGGSNANYGNNENLTLTLCPQEAGGQVIFSLIEFSTQTQTDILYVYNGDSTSSQLIAQYSGTSPNLPPSQASNPTGCLTLNFVSDGAGTSSGWLAEVLCVAGPFTINQPSDFLACDDLGGGSAVFDLQSKDAEILGNLNPANYEVSYYLTQIDADNQTNPLPSPFTNFTNPQTIYVNVNQLATGNFEQTSFDLIVNGVPNIDLLDVYTLCNGTTLNVDSGFSATGNTFAWYYDGILIPNEENPDLDITQTGSYQFQVITEFGCSVFTSFEVTDANFNDFVPPTPFVQCDNDGDGFMNFDLSSKLSEIINGSNVPDLLVTFHETLFDADAGANALPLNYSNITPYLQTIYVRVSSSSGTCFTTASLDLIVDITCLSVQDVTIEVCTQGPNGTEVFDLTMLNETILGVQDISGYTFTYYQSETNAIAEVNPISNPTNYTNTSTPEIIYVRVEQGGSGNVGIATLTLIANMVPNVDFNGPYTVCSGSEIVLTPFVNGVSDLYTYAWSTGATDPEIVVFTAGTYSVTVTDIATGCTGTASVVVNEGITPALVEPSDLFNCGTNATYDLTSVTDEMLGGVPEANFIINYYPDLSSAYNGSNAISNPTAYSPTQQVATIYVKVQNINDYCFEITDFNLITNSSCPVDVVCEDGPVNVTFCYANNDITVYSFQSTNGSQITAQVNAGFVEVNWDEFVVIDSDGVTNLNGSNPYGNNGDLTGLSFVSTGSTLTIYVDADISASCATNGYVPLDIDISCVDTTAIPNCNASLTSPLDQAVDVDEDVVLEWSPASVLVDGYTVSVGITSGGTEIIDNQDVGNVQSLDLGSLEYETTYYVSIVPYNANGDAEGCTEESFTTRSNPFQFVVCDDGPVNTTYCYGNDDTTEFSFESTDGLPLIVTFNSGGTEVNYDQIVVLDSDGNILNPNEPYGINGDFTGLSYVSTGSQLSVLFNTDGSVSCQTGNSCCTEVFDFDVQCTSDIGIIDIEAFVDSNTNNILDANEVNFLNGYFTYELNNDGVINEVTSSSGSFQILSTNPSDTYDITYNLYEESAGCYDVSLPIFENVSVATGQTIDVHFPIVEEQDCEDLAVYLVSTWAPPRPGFSHTNQLILENLGFSTITSGSVAFELDPQLVFNAVTNVNPNYTVTTTATGFNLDFVNLQPGQSEVIYISLSCPASVELGEIVTNSATYVTDSNDMVGDNNYSTLSEVVVGSWDPNDKMEAHGPRIDYNAFVTSDEYLYYTIRFQNLGTAAATFIRINDMLDNQLDETTFQMLRSSHDYVVTRTDNELEWFFEDINLPAEQDDLEGSQGFVYFRIKPLAGYVVGDIIPNTAAIYFDYNAPVITNRFDSEFVEENLSVNEIQSLSFQLSPNPAKDRLNIIFPNPVENIQISILDLQGKIVLESQLTGNQIQTLDVSALQSGMYFVKVNNQKNQMVKKLVIE
ncbi:DUF7619 domain-containing protein [Psychroserpens sp. BH13MA-6]